MSNDVVETKMFAIFHLINDWLKYSEAKNLAIVALSGAACSALVTYLSSSQDLTPCLKNTLWTSVCFFALSCIVSLLSFTPRTSQERLLALYPDWGTPSENDNLYFYKDIGKYKEADRLAKKYEELFSPSPNATSKETPSSHKQLAEQMVANSRIVVYKLRFFLVALILAIIAVGASLLSLFI